MLILALIPVLMGAGLATQTAINSKLRHFVGSPYVASGISFAIGMLFLIILCLLTGHSLTVTSTFIATQPWWIWLGGLLGVIGLTGNIILFNVLGSIQASVLPILGQIIMGVIIDQFGLFNSPTQPMTLIKLMGIILVIVGVCITIGVFNPPNPMGQATQSQNRPQHQFLYQLFGVIAGMLMATQTAINGHLGVALNSSMQAAAISFTIGTLVLLVVIILTRADLTTIKAAISGTATYHWLWFGGFIGGAYILCSSWLVPKIGTGQVVVLALFGQLLFSAIIEHAGLFDSFSVRIDREKIIGLILMFISVLGIHFL